MQHAADEAFRFIQLFFENSLREVEQCNSGIATTHRMIDTNHVTAVIYKGGKTASHCRIILERSHQSSDDIRYSNDFDMRNNYYSESLHVENDDQSIYLKALDMQRRHSKDAHLTFDGAAEYYWSLLFERLQ